MKNWLTNLFTHPKPADTETAVDAKADLLAAQKAVQTMRIELAERDRTIANLKGEVERQRMRQEEVIKETTASQLGGLFAELAAPASQILTQADLLENQAKPVQARDVLAVARRMVRALERNGLTFEGQIGQQEAYDPNRHTPMSAAAAPQTSQPVTIRFVGVSYGGKMIYKAVVE